VGEPLSNCPASKCWWGGSKGQSIGRVEMAGKFIEEVVVLAQYIGRAGKQWHGVALRNIGHQGKKLVAHPISLETGVGIGRIIDSGNTRGLAQGMGVGAAKG
jgi:hypothetical protein